MELEVGIVEDKLEKVELVLEPEQGFAAPDEAPATPRTGKPAIIPSLAGRSVL